MSASQANSLPCPAVVFAQVDEPVVSIIVVAWRSAPYAIGCLRSVARHAHTVPYEVILVLNEPTEALETAVQRSVYGVTVLRTRTNVGFAGAVNLAARRARGEYLLLLNDDTEVFPGWLEQLVDTAERRPEAGAVGSKVLLPDGTIQEAGSVVWADGWTFTVGRGLAGTTKRFDFERRVDYCSGCSLLVRRSTWEAVGGLDESYYPVYFEEADLCLRIARLGQQVWFQPRSVVLHYESASTNDDYRQFLLDRNHEVFAARWSEELASREPRVAAHEPAVERAVWKAMGDPVRVLLIDDRVPDRAIGSGFARMADVIETLVATGRYHLSLLASLEDGFEQNDWLARLGVEVIDEPLADHVAKQGLGYSLVVVSRPHNYERIAPMVRELLPGVPIVYDAEALYHVRIERQAALATDPLEKAALAREAAEMRATEQEIAADADHLVCISEEEAVFFRRHARCPVEVNAPLLLAPRPTLSGFSSRAGIGFVAGWFAGARSPNADGLIWFARRVLPLVRARVPGTKLLVTGAEPPRNVRRLEGDAVGFVGEVDDLQSFYARVRVVVVPARYGAGVKIKTIEALQFAVPTVATTVGAEGIPLDDPDVLLVADDPAELAAAIATLLEDGAAWERQRRRILDQQRRWEAAGARPIWPELVQRLSAPVATAGPALH